MKRPPTVLEFPNWAAEFLAAVCPQEASHRRGAPGRRSASVRALIGADVRDALAAGGLGDRGLLLSLRRATIRRHHPTNVQVGLYLADLRPWTERRANALGLTLTEYIVALLVREGAHRGIAVDHYRARESARRP